MQFRSSFKQATSTKPVGEPLFASIFGCSVPQAQHPSGWFQILALGRLAPECLQISMSGLDPCSFPIVSPGTDGGDKPFCPDELCVNALDRLNATGETMGRDALPLDEGEAGFSSTRTGWFRVTKPAPNEARSDRSRPLIVSRSCAPSMRREPVFPQASLPVL